MTSLSTHLEALASPSTGGRVRGTVGHRRARDYIEGVFRSYLTPLADQKGYVQEFRRWEDPVPYANLLGCHPGSREERYVLIGAHYDTHSCSPFGADDNASGMSVLLSLVEQARFLSRNIIFCAFDGEEFRRGRFLVGSSHFVRTHKELVRHIDLAIILDLVGGALLPSTWNELYLFGLEHMVPKLSVPEQPPLKIVPLPTQAIEPFSFLPGLRNFVARSDYRDFRTRAVPYLFLSSGVPYYYHTPEDLPGVVSIEKLIAVSDWVARLIQTLKTGPIGWKRQVGVSGEEESAVRHVAETVLNKSARWGKGSGFHTLLRLLLATRFVRPRTLYLNLLFYSVVKLLKKIGKNPFVDPR